jgi:hypothetical protein
MDRIVADGWERLSEGCRQYAEAEVLAAHTDELRSLGFVRRWLLLRRLRRNIQVRAEALEPNVSPESLF